MVNTQIGLIWIRSDSLPLKGRTHHHTHGLTIPPLYHIWCHFRQKFTKLRFVLYSTPYKYHVHV